MAWHAMGFSAGHQRWSEYLVNVLVRLRCRGSWDRYVTSSSQELRTKSISYMSIAMGRRMQDERESGTNKMRQQSYFYDLLHDLYASDGILSALDLYFYSPGLGLNRPSFLRDLS